MFHDTAQHNFANLVMNELNILIPQSDIYSLEPATDMLANHDGTTVLGFFKEQEKHWPIYALSSELSLLSNRPQNYRIIILFKNVTRSYGLLCEQIYALKSEQIILHNVPSAMHTITNVISQLAQYNEQVYCVSSAQLLSHLINNS